MSPGRKHKAARESRGSPPARMRAGRYKCAPDDLSRILQSKGFAGGVPLNTERTTVKPWVGIYPDSKRCLFFVEMARAGGKRRTQNPPALQFPARGCVTPPGWSFAALCSVMKRQSPQVHLPRNATVRIGWAGFSLHQTGARSSMRIHQLPPKPCPSWR